MKIQSRLVRKYKITNNILKSWDYDIISSTDNPQFVNGKYPDQRVVTYDVKKPHKKLFTEDDLFVTDTFSFGTQIGQITNTCSTICALMAEFPEDSEEYKLLGDRLKAGCAAQSRQINSWSAHRVIYV